MRGMDNYVISALQHDQPSVNETSTTTGSVTTFVYEDSSKLTQDNATDYLNISRELPMEYAVPMYGYAMPFLLLITIVANTLIVVVLSKKHMRTPTNAVLMAMALSDMFTLLFPAPWLLYMYSFGNHYKPLSPIAACYAWNVMNEVIPTLFHTASIWLTLALAVQRYIYVCHAPVARTWCTMPRVLKCIAWISLLAFLHQFSRFFEKRYEPVLITWRGQPNITVYRVQYSHWLGDDQSTLNIYFIVYYSFRVIFVHMGPCISLVILNLLLFKAMRAAQLKRNNLFNKENRKSEYRRLRESNCTTLMLIVVVTVFLLTEIPLAVLTILHMISSVVIEILDYRVVNILILFTNFFIIVSYPINFAIYCGMSRQFRETFRELFIRGTVPVTRRNGGSSKYSLVNGPRTCTNETVL